MKILVTDGNSRAALAVVRSLGRQGHAVYVCGSGAGDLCRYSRYCAEFIQVSDAIKSPTSFAEEIFQAAAENGIDVLIPITEQSIYSLNVIRDRLSGLLLFACPDAESMESVSNKYHLFRLATELGVDVPQTTFIDDWKDFTDKSDQISTFPVVVKPALSKIMLGDRILPARVRYAHNKKELIDLYRDDPTLRSRSLIQELVVGPGTAVFTLYDKDKPLVLFSHRRLIEKPPAGGVSVLSESIELETDMVNAASKLLSAAGWQGVAMVEFKRDKRDGRAKLMEVNGRFWGSLQLAISCGVDFPSLYLNYCMGKSIASTICDYKRAHRLKWFLGVLDHLLIRLNRGGGDELADLPSLRFVVMQLLTCSQNTSSDVFDTSDPKPFISEMYNYLKHLIRG